MSKKHFIYAANQIIQWCSINGPDYQNCPIYDFITSMFYEFGTNFSKQTFNAFIEKALNDL